jgi:hypothetical protein
VVERTVVWLAGVRRVGKTCLAQSLDPIEYFDCELPRVRRQMDDPQEFLARLNGKRIVLDEIHRLSNPSELLKIAADHYAGVRILATGSSTLGASSKFRDTLTDRKRDVWLTPMTIADNSAFGPCDMEHRFLRGGLPPFFMASKWQEREYQDWMDAYWAKDIQELFRLERKASFARFVELLLAQSGGLFEATAFAQSCEVSRPTIANYLAVLDATFVAHVLRPFHTRPGREILAQPKVYGFDTGFVCCFRGWQSLRPDDMGLLWEHLVLNELHAALQTRAALRYWRQKDGREVDFVIARHGRPPVVIECKWRADAFDPTAVRAFQRFYPSCTVMVVAHDVDRPCRRVFGDVPVEFVSLRTLIERLT